MKAGTDGSITIDTSVDTSGFSAAMSKMKSSLKEITSGLFGEGNEVIGLFSSLGSSVGKVVGSVGKAFGSIGKLFGSIGSLFSGNKLSAGMGALSKSTGALGSSFSGVASSAGSAAAGIGTAFLGAASAVAAVVAAVVGAAVAIFSWAQKMTNTLYNSLSATSVFRAEVVALKGSFDTLKNTMTALGATFLSFIAPAIQNVINWLVTAINWVNQFVAALAGRTQYMKYVSNASQQAAGSTGAAAKSTDKLASSTKKAAKEAKGALAAFDQINVLQKESAAEADTPAPDLNYGGGGGGGQAVEGGDMTMENVDIDPKILGTATKIREWLGGAWDWVKEKAALAWQGIVTVWNTVSEWFKIHVWDPIANWFTEHVITPLAGGWETLKAKFMDFWQNVIVPAFDWIKTNIWPTIQKIALGIGEFFSITIPLALDGLVGNLKAGFDMFKNIFKDVWTTITNVVLAIMKVIGGIIDFITGVFTKNWDKAWQGIKDIFGGIWDGMLALSKGVVNLVIDVINGMISGVVSGVNAVINALNKIQLEIPPILGKPGYTFGINLPNITAPQIPHLAQGAVIPPNAEFLAVLGDQRRGTNIEAPLDTIKQAVAEVLGTGGGDMTIPITLTLDGEVLYQNQKKIQWRRGSSLIAEGGA